MSTLKQVLVALDLALETHGRALVFADSTPLLGALPELDSMAVARLIVQLEQTFKITVYDDEIDGSVFESVATLTRFVDEKLQQF